MSGLEKYAEEHGIDIPKNLEEAMKLDKLLDSLGEPDETE